MSPADRIGSEPVRDYIEEVAAADEAARTARTNLAARLGALLRVTFNARAALAAQVPEPSLDIERLAMAMMLAESPGWLGDKRWQKESRRSAERIAAEYARLTPDRTPTE